MKKLTRIMVTWLGGSAFDFLGSPKEAYERVGTLKSAGFTDARIDWERSS